MKRIFTVIFVTLMAVSISSVAYAGKGAGGGGSKGANAGGTASTGYQGGTNANFELPDGVVQTFDGTGDGYGDGTQPAPKDGTGFGKSATSSIEQD